MTTIFPTPSHQTTVNTRIGELKYENEYPSKETVSKLYDEIDFQRALPGVPSGVIPSGERCIGQA